MDPFAAIGLASNIVQFVDYSTKIIHGAREIYESASGMTNENKSLESTVSKMKELSSKLLPTTGATKSEDERALCRVAAECNILADQILELLGRIRPKDPKSKRQSAMAAMKNKLREREKQELEKRLENCRSQLELQLNFLTSSETKTRLEILVKSAEGDAAKFEQLQTHIDRLHQGVTVTSITPQAQAQLRKLLNLSEDACRIIIQQRILNNLAFDDMHGRYEAVDSAHYRTFEWIFENSPELEDEGFGDKESGSKGSGDDDSDGAEHIRRDRSAPESFIHWLSSGKGIFHISGKLGSGKSTLMKFLCEHKRTEKELQKWAGNKKLVFANFFFWKPGMLLQRSLNGLFRSLLHDTLKACPELIPTVLPDQWNEVKSMPWQVQTELQLGKRDIRAAFSRLIEHRNQYEKHCFCYFIDGLDEYEETHQEDYKSMVELLCSWTTAAPEDVKICVSSREYNVFLNAFSSERRLRLQDLTRGDMKRYVRDKLKNSGDEKLEQLVQKITDKGSGIFLWVALVVKSLRERLEDGHKLAALEGELDSLPDELEGLFEYLLKSVDKLARKKAYQIFAMILKLQPYGLGLSLLQYSFLEDYENDPAFSVQTVFPHYSMGDAARRDRIDLARKKVNGYCRGLLEVGGDDMRGNISDIGFTHRSIPEFLEKPIIQIDMNFGLKNFNIIDAISQLLLAEMRSTNPNSIEREELSLTTYVIVDLRHQVRADHAPFSFLECLCSTVIQHEVPEPEDYLHKAGRYCETATTAWVVGSVGSVGSRPSARFITSPLHALAIIGDDEYVKWKTEHDKDVLGSNYQIAVLLCCVYLSLFVKGRSEAFNLLEFLLKRGLSPQAVIHTTGATTLLRRVVELSFWVHFILIALSEYKVDHGAGFLKGLGETIETFLQYGADPRFSISIPKKRHYPSRDASSDDEDLSTDSQPDDVDVDDDSMDSSHEYAEIILGREEHISVRTIHMRTSEYEFIIDNGGKASLRELIEFWAFENQETILQLIDRNLEEQQASERQDQQEVLEETVIAKEADNEPTLKPEPESTVEEEAVATPTQNLKSFGYWVRTVAWSPVITFLLGVVLAILILRLL